LGIRIWFREGGSSHPPQGASRRVMGLAQRLGPLRTLRKFGPRSLGTPSQEGLSYPRFSIYATAPAMILSNPSSEHRVASEWLMPGASYSGSSDMVPS